jgi:hypothetical protein
MNRSRGSSVLGRGSLRQGTISLDKTTRKAWFTLAVTRAVVGLLDDCDRERNKKPMQEMVYLLTWASLLPALIFELECFSFFLDTPAVSSSSPGRLPADIVTVAIPPAAAAACSWYDAPGTLRGSARPDACNDHREASEASS